MSPGQPGSSGVPSRGDVPKGERPSDLELMLWIDGELDDRRAVEVEAFVARDARARDVVASLRQAGDILATHALSRAQSKGADSIADRVMTAIDTAPSPPAAPIRSLFRTRVAVVAFAAAAGIAFLLLPSRGTRGPEATHGAPKVPTAVGTVIDVVDFGARPGTIFYVPSEDESTTAVVWLTEDDTGPDDSSPSSGETL